jgi:serine/threonine protein kinase
LALDTKKITKNINPNMNRDNNQQLQAGSVLEERYLIESILGVGGMSAVYRARDLRFTVDKPVAVKEMVNQARDAVVRQTIVKNFEREANILATLNHYTIPKIYDYFTINKRSYLVMELIQGENLEDIINKTQGFLPTDLVVSWAIDLCDVLHHLHTHQPEPIVFRDMKPANIIVTPGNKVVLVDFGIAKPFQTGQRGTMIGTEGYSPPEQYRGEATPLVDIFALGATLHHILTRTDPRIEPPFTFADRPIQNINPAVSAELSDVIIKAVEYAPSDRHSSAGEMKEALINVARQTGILSQIPADTAGIIQTYDINPLWVFACEDEIRGTAAHYGGAIFVGAYDNNLYSLDAGTGEFNWKYATDGGIVTKPVIHQNGVYFGSEDNRLHVLYPNNGKIIWSYYTDGPIRSSPFIIDRHVFFGSDDGQLHVVNVSTGRPVLKIEIGVPIRSTPLVFDDMIYFGAENGDFYCTNFRGEIKWRARAKRGITSSPIIVDNAVYFGSLDSQLYALDLQTGWTLWRFRMGKGSISTPCVVDDFIFTGSADGNIYCVNKHTSKEVWRFTTEHQVTGSPIIHNNSVYCGSVDGNLYCIEYKTGRLLWKYKTEGPITGTPIIHNDVVYIGSNDHSIYALPA